MKFKWIRRNTFVSFYKNLGIKKQLFMVNLFTVLVGTVLSLIALEYGLKIYDNIMYKEAAQVLNLSTVSIENELKRIDNLSMQISSDNIVQDYAKFVDDNKNKNSQVYKSIEKLIEKIRLITGFENKKYIKSIIFIDNDGIPFSSGNSGYLDEKDEDDSVLKTFDKKGEIVFMKSRKEEEILLAGRTIREKAGLSFEKLGYIVLKIDFDDLISSYTEVLPYDVNLVIYSDDKIIYTSNKKQNIKINDLKTKYDSGYEIKSLNKEKYFITYGESDYTKWKYANLISYESIFEKSQYLRKILIGMFLLIFFIVIILSVRFSIGITKPIERLTVKMKKAENGIFDLSDTDTDNIIISNNEIFQLQKDFNYMIKRINHLINENYVKQIVIKDTQLRALQAQINPHFLYNTLESINWMAKINKMNDISIMVESLGNLLRNSIDEKGVLISLKEEITLVKSYFNIQKIRYEDALEFTLNIDECLLVYKIPKLTLQPIIENSIHYGLESCSEVNIKITSDKYKNYFEIIIKDDGPGVKDDLLKKLNSGKVEPKGFGTGLKNINERIKIIFGDGYGLHIENIIEGTQVTISIPYSVGE